MPKILSYSGVVFLLEYLQKFVLGNTKQLSCVYNRIQNSGEAWTPAEPAAVQIEDMVELLHSQPPRRYRGVAVITLLLVRRARKVER